MNVYVLVEGERTEVEVYRHWIKFLNPNLSEIDHIAQFAENNFYLFSGYGYPFYFRRIREAIETVNELGNIQRLVIATDSEDLDYEEKYNELARFVEEQRCEAEIRIVIQHFCFETWALGNRKIIGRNIQDPIFRRYNQFFNTAENDPELMPPYPPERLNRARFAERYLVRALRDRYSRLIYSKRSPNIVCNPQYFAQVKKRFEQAGHIKSFQGFLEAFSD